MALCSEKDYLAGSRVHGIMKWEEGVLFNVHPED